MNRFFFFAIALVVGLVATQAFAGSASKIDNISAENLKKMHDDSAHFILIDARRVEDYNKEHITKAISLPANDVNSKTLDEIAPDNKTKLVFYCQNVKCQASHIAASKALGAGYKYIYEFNGGIEAWKEHGYPTEAADKVEVPVAEVPAEKTQTIEAPAAATK